MVAAQCVRRPSYTLCLMQYYIIRKLLIMKLSFNETPFIENVHEAQAHEKGIKI